MMNVIDILRNACPNAVMTYDKWVMIALNHHICVSSVQALIKDRLLINAGTCMTIDKVNGCDMAPDDDFDGMIDYDADNDVYTFQTTHQLYKLADA